ncbi:MAG: hypothetical protein E7552_06435, partial [Ruminococcaceae bacterium]|nr:hypothetical protein [Oscillospiraceae bacterium]
MKEFMRKSVATVLCLCLVISCMPIIAFAADDAPTQTPTSSENVFEEPFIIDEIESKRESNAKHYRMSDGSYLAASYEIPVHF